MSVKNEYLSFREANALKTHVFEDRVCLQRFLKDRLNDIWDAKPTFSNGGLLSNYMTRFALGFAYYDCRPSSFCKSRCYGLPLSGLHDFYMLRLGVITSESLKTGDERYLQPLKAQLKTLDLRCLKIGHWGDAVSEQVPHIAQLVREFPSIAFWWYTRKREVAISANELGLLNLRTYLSLDPATEFPNYQDYPFGLTYLFGDGLRHGDHDAILRDRRLVAVFPLKKRSTIEDPAFTGVADHPRVCIEKRWAAQSGKKGSFLCLSCSGRCNYL